jgi:hypothetical protein
MKTVIFHILLKNCLLLKIVRKMEDRNLELLLLLWEVINLPQGPEAPQPGRDVDAVKVQILRRTGLMTVRGPPL